jgi:hypothetical protein
MTHWRHDCLHPPHAVRRRSSSKGRSICYLRSRTSYPTTNLAAYTEGKLWAGERRGSRGDARPVLARTMTEYAIRILGRADGSSEALRVTGSRRSTPTAPS